MLCVREKKEKRDHFDIKMRPPSVVTPALIVSYLFIKGLFSAVVPLPDVNLATKTAIKYNTASKITKGESKNMKKLKRIKA